jgi:hypothetical protein
MPAQVGAFMILSGKPPDHLSLLLKFAVTYRDLFLESVRRSCDISDNF